MSLSDRIAPVWQLHHISTDDRTLAIQAMVPCGAVYDDFSTVAELVDGDVAVAIDAEVEQPPSGCESADVPVDLQITLDEPLAGRTVVDAADPSRQLDWVVPPGAVQAYVAIESEPGAVADTFDDACLAIGIGDLHVPVSISQIREGIRLPVPLVLERSGQHVGHVGVVHDLPLQLDEVRDRFELALPPPLPDHVVQQLVVVLGDGAVGGSPSSPRIAGAQVRLSWQPDQ